MWNVDTAKIAFSLHAHTGPVNAVALDPSKTQMVSAGTDTSLLIWNVNMHRQKSIVIPKQPNLLDAKTKTLIPAIAPSEAAHEGQLNSPSAAVLSDESEATIAVPRPRTAAVLSKVIY